MAVSENSVSKLLDNLPAVFQADRETGKPEFLGRFLLAFERVLLGLGETSSSAPEAGLEEIIGGGPVDGAHLAGMHRYFESGFVGDNHFLAPAESTPAEFLTWLAGWLTITLREDWAESQQRELIAKASHLYRLRGTKSGVEEFLQLYTHRGIVINEFNAPFQIGVHSRVGVDTILGGGAPFYFHVKVLLPVFDAASMKKLFEIATAVVELQKPAHTFYKLTIETPIFQIGVHSRVGVDTLIG